MDSSKALSSQKIKKELDKNSVPLSCISTRVCGCGPQPLLGTALQTSLAEVAR
jgi:hypothetical protein